MKKLNITFCSTPDYSSNAKALYEYMKKRYNSSMNYTWIVRTEKVKQKLLSKGINAILLGTSDYYEYVRKTNVFFTTHCDITGDKPEGSLYVELWHGVGPKAIGHLVKNISEGDFNWYSSISKTMDYLVVPSHFFATIFATQFNMNAKRLLRLGMPKLDYFAYSDGKKNLTKITNKNLSKYNKIMYYMPTFRKGCGRKSDSEVNTKNIFNFSEYDENVLFNYLEKNKYLLCIKYHPNEELTFKNFDHENICIIKDDILIDEEISINELLNAADLMITDYSSLGTEFAFLNKPIIYLTDDVNEYKENRGVVFENMEFWTPGYSVKNIDELLSSIELSLYNNPYMPALLERRNLWFGELKDGGCNQLCDFLFDDNKISNRVIYYEDIETKLRKEKNELGIDIERIEKENNELVTIINRLEEEKIQTAKEISNIYSSKSWRALTSLRTFKNKFMFWRKK